MSDVFFGCFVLFEDLIIKIVNLVVFLKKVFVDDVKGLGMKEGFVKFKLFRNVGNIGDGVINVKVGRILLVFNILLLDLYYFIFVIIVICGVLIKIVLF